MTIITVRINHDEALSLLTITELDELMVAIVRCQAPVSWF